MYNKLLADLIRERLNNELEKIKLELFEDDYYTEDIEDSIEVVKTQLAPAKEEPSQPVSAVQPMEPEKPAEPVQQPVAQVMEVKDVPHEEPKKEEPPLKFQEINLSGEEPAHETPSQEVQTDPNKQLEQKISNLNAPRESVDMTKVGMAVIIFIALLAGAYFYFFAN